MRILFPVGAFYPSQVGGPCNTIYWHTTSLVKNGVDVVVVTTNKGINPGDVPLNRIYENESGHVFYGTGEYNNLKVIFKAVGYIRKCDIIHINSLFNILSIICFFYSYFFSRAKIIWSVRGELSPSAFSYGIRKKAIIIFLYKLFTKQVLFHSTSEDETILINKFFKKSKIIQLPNYLQPSQRLIVEKKKQILFVGRIHPIKAIHKLIEAVSLSNQFRGEDYKLILVGNYELRHTYYYEELLQLILQLRLESKVEFRGHISGFEKEKLYAESTLLVLPSESENFGNVVVEALNQGTPVIASKGTPWAILEKYNCGFYTENLPGELAKAIDKIIDANESEYIKMSQNAIELMDKEFNIDTQIYKWIENYTSL